MADIEVSMKHGTTREQARTAVDRSLGKMRDKMGVGVSWDGDTATLEAPGVKSGVITVDDANIKIEIALGLMGKPMKPMIEKMIKQGFEKALGSGS